MTDTEAQFLAKYGMLPCPFSVLYPPWDIEYADDTVLLTNSGDTLERLLHMLQTNAARIGLTLNKEKCQLMTLKSTRLLHFKTEGTDACQCPNCTSTPPLRLAPLSLLLT